MTSPRPPAPTVPHDRAVLPDPKLRRRRRGTRLALGWLALGWLAAALLAAIAAAAPGAPAAASTGATTTRARPEVPLLPTAPAAGTTAALSAAGRQSGRPVSRTLHPLGTTGARPALGWRWPLPGRPEITRRFDPPRTPYGPGHRGVDLAAAPGTPVLAAGPGVVAWAGVLAGRGVVSVRHAGGLRTTYEPVTPTVRAGQPVAASARLGLLAAGHPGCPRPACLHWGLLRGDVYLDPLALVGRGPVRLLPLSGGASGSAAPAEPTAGFLAGPAAPTPVTQAAVISRGTTAATFCFVCAGVLLMGRRWPP